MADSKHRKPRGSNIDKFCGCAPYGVACACGNKYRNTGKPSPWFFPYQAHHLLPVTCINSELISKSTIQGVLRKTVWCINAKENTYGMPTWGMTVNWYCKITKVLRSLRVGQPAPVWKNIPQHLNDHNIYNKEVNGYLGHLAVSYENADHDAEEDDIKGDLEELSSDMKSDLKDRGIRKDGTHAAWTNAINASTQGNEYAGWYEPFSMAQDPCVRAFPIRGDSSSVSAWIDRISEALCK